MICKYTSIDCYLKFVETEIIRNEFANQKKKITINGNQETWNQDIEEK